MKVIHLKNYGHFLSGRSLPIKIVAELNGETEIALDFSGVAACNQSFLNELFQKIESAGYKLTEITLQGLDSPVLKSMVETEKTRFIQITTIPFGAVK